VLLPSLDCLAPEKAEWLLCPVRGTAGYFVLPVFRFGLRKGMTMRSRTLHVLRCAVIAATLAGISTLAQAKVYPITWDPTFGGDVQVDLVNDAGCRGLGDNIWNTTSFPVCQLDLTVVDVFDLLFPLVHYTSFSLPIVNVATHVEIFGGNFNQFRTGPIFLDEIGGCGDFCGTATIQFFISENPSDPFPGFATLKIVPFDGDPADPTTLSNSYRVPEPGTLGLLLGALGAGWLAKRRKTKA